MSSSMVGRKSNTFTRLFQSICNLLGGEKQNLRRRDWTLERLGDRLVPAGIVCMWTGAAVNTLMSTPANWVANTVPGPGDIVIIDRTNQSIIWDLAGVTTLQTLRLENLFGGTLTISGDLRFDEIQVMSGSLEIPSGSKVSTGSGFVGSTITGLGSFEVSPSQGGPNGILTGLAGGGVLVGQTIIDVGQTLNISGAFTFAGTEVIQQGTVIWNNGPLLINSSSFTNTGDFYFQAPAGDNIFGIGTIKNYGLVEKQSIGNTNVFPRFNNYGTGGGVRVTNGVLTFDSPLAGGGLIASEEGHSEVLAGASLRWKAPRTIVGTVTVDGPGTLSIAGDITVLSGQNLTVTTGDVIVNVNGYFAGPGSALFNAPVEWRGGGFSNFGNELSILRELSITTAAEKSLSSTTLVRSARTDWSGGNIKLANDAAVENYGLWEIQGDFTIEEQGGGTFTNGGGTRGWGTVVKTSGAGTTTFGLETMNSGDMFFQGRTIDFTHGLTQFPGGRVDLGNTGKMVVGAGSKFWMDGGSLEFLGTGTVDGDLEHAAGTIHALASGVLSITGTYVQTSANAELHSTFSGDWGRLAVNGVATLANGTLIAEVLAGDPGFVWRDVVTANSVGGTLAGPPAGYEIRYNPAGAPTAVQIRKPPAKVMGAVWKDLNGDGVWNGGEVGLSGASVTLVNDQNALSYTVSTDSAGAYVFPTVPTGTYHLEFSQVLPNGTFSPPGADSDADPITGWTLPFTVNPGAALTNWDAGLVPPSGDLGDLVWLDLNADGIQNAGEPGVEGISVDLLDAQGFWLASTLTDAAGHYLFADVPAGDYQIRVHSGSGFTAPNAGSDDTLDSDVDSAGYTPLFTFGGSADDLTLDAGLQGSAPGGTVTGQVWRDRNLDGLRDLGDDALGGAWVELVNSITGTILSTMTDSSGVYLFSDVPTGTYHVKFQLVASFVAFSPIDQGSDDTLDSDAFSSGLSDTFPLTSGQVIDHLDCGQLYFEDVGSGNTGVISGRIWNDDNSNGIQDMGESGVAGAQVELTETTIWQTYYTTSNANGNYTFTDLPAGTYEVHFRAFYAIDVFSPADQGNDDTIDSDVGSTTGTTPGFTLSAGQTIANVDAGLLPDTSGGGGGSGGTATVRGRVWWDQDADGIEDASELGLYGETVELYDSNTSQWIATVTTNSNGEYEFTGIAPGTYYVRFYINAATGWYTTPGQGSDESIDSDAALTFGWTESFSLVAGSLLEDLDAGFVIPQE